MPPHNDLMKQVWLIATKINGAVRHGRNRPGIRMHGIGAPIALGAWYNVESTGRSGVHTSDVTLQRTRTISRQ